MLLLIESFISVSHIKGEHCVQAQARKWKKQTIRERIKMSISRKLNKCLTTTIIALLVLSTFTFLYSVEAVTPGTIALSPASGQPGSSVTVTGGDGNFSADETVYTYFQGVALPVTNSVASATGNLTATFNVPQVVAGTYTVTSSGAISGKSYQTTYTVVSPTIAFNNNATSAGANVTITLTNFAFGAVVRISFGGASWVNTTALASGNGTTTALVPSHGAGVYTVSATDGLNTATAGFTILPEAITLAPVSGPIASQVEVKGSGFPIGSLVLIYGAGTFLTSVSADENGNFTRTITVSVLSAVSSYLVQAQDYLGNVASATFSIPTPTIAISPNKGAVGTTVFVNGTNFKASPVTPATVTISVDGHSIATPTTNATGAFVNANGIIPDLVAGAHTLSASDGIFNITATFTVSAPTITASPTGGANGTSITVTGAKFKLSSTVNIKFDGTSLANVTADGTGAFSQAITSPNIAAGLYTINATDGVNFATATFNAGPTILTATNTGSNVPGAKVTVTGAGFTPNGAVTINFDSTVVNATVTAAANGTFTGTFIVPDVTSGAHQLHALDVTTNITSVAFTYTVANPQMTLNPSSNVQVGQLIMVSGDSFKLSSTVTITFNGATVTTVTARNTGALPSNTNFTVPSVVPGTYTVSATDGINTNSTTLNLVGTGGIDQVIAMLSTNGSFWNFTNDWFMTINNKLGIFTGNDTVASLLYSIEAKVSVPNPLAFDFGQANSAWQPAVIHVTDATVYNADLGYGWTDVTGLGSRNRVSPNPALAGFVFGSASKTFQVALPNGDYTVAITQGDCNFAHDKMTIIANGELVGTVTTPAGQSVQTTVKVTVEDGLLQLTFGKAAGAVDTNWVVNGVTIFNNWT